MTKKDFAVKIASECGCTQKQVSDVIQKTLECITGELAAGHSVELRNFGVFEVKTFRKRIGRNPRKPQETVVIPERTVVRFRAGKIMKEQVEKTVK